MLNKLSHIGIAVKSIEESLPLYRDLFGCRVESVKEMPERGLKIAFLDVGGTAIELLEGTADNSAITGFVEKRGGGIHHLCFSVPDIDSALGQLSGEGVRLIDKEARPGAEGHPVAFLHPSSTGKVLIELEES